MIIQGHEVRSGVREEVDVCVIGSGAGGATVARELCRKGFSVVVLEEGGAYFTEDFTGRIKDASVKMYRNQGLDATTGIPAVLLPTGKCLGGTTVINSGTCFRAPDSVLRSWADMGLEDYSPEKLSPYYDRVEEEMSVQPVKPEVMGRAGELIAQGAEKLGLHPKPIRRNVSDACKGCGNCPYGCTEAAKQAMILNAIPEADRMGAKFYCDARALELVREDDKIVGVHGHILDRETGAFRHNFDIAARAVVLCAGALNTPALLLKNGLANRSGQVGKNLKLHLCARTTGIFEEKVHGDLGVCQNLYIDDYLDQGIMLEATFTGPASQLVGLIGVGKELWELSKAYAHMASLGIMISEKSSGRVRADEDANPSVSFHVQQEDAETLFKAMIIADRILFAAGAKKVLNGNFKVPVVEKMADLDKLAREETKPADFLLAAFHPQGTCRMGVNPKKSVVGPDGKCHDLENLYIADASIFPTSLGVNPQETIWAMAVKISEHIAQALEKKT